MHLILLSGENLRLARLEAERILGLGQTSLFGNRLYCTIPTDNIKIMNRLAYAKKIYEIVYVTARKNLEDSLKTYPWINYYEKNFCLRITSEEHYDERYYSGFVWNSLEKSIRPSVNLENPKLFIEIFIDKEKATVTRLLYQNFETFEDRKAHLRPVLHPTAMHPKMARALINILNPGPKEKIFDPFCGACGILTEAGLLGIKFEGYDIDKKILDDARKNMEFYDIRPGQYKLMVKDSTKIKNLRNVVTDLPYGKSSKKSDDLVTLYAKFLRNLSGKAVVVMPNFMPYKALLNKNLPKSLTVIDIIDHYVHKSLTRKIVMIDLKGKKFTTSISNNIIKKRIKKIVGKTSVRKKKPKKYKHIKKVKTHLQKGKKRIKKNINNIRKKKR
jgi:putative methyltransferase (TIGR01177 family)